MHSTFPFSKELFILHVLHGGQESQKQWRRSRTLDTIGHSVLEVVVTFEIGLWKLLVSSYTDLYTQVLVHKTV